MSCGFACIQGGLDGGSTSGVSGVGFGVVVADSASSVSVVVAELACVDRGALELSLAVDFLGPSTFGHLERFGFGGCRGAASVGAAGARFAARVSVGVAGADARGCQRNSLS